jgi:hypothetical protein
MTEEGMIQERKKKKKKHAAGAMTNATDFRYIRM